MTREFVSYAFKHLPRKKIIKYASQYLGVNMAELMGANEENLLFLVGDAERGFMPMLWNVYCGIRMIIDEDSVRAYAAIEYLREHGYPIFASAQAAQDWAEERDWPKKPWPPASGPESTPSPGS